MSESRTISVEIDDGSGRRTTRHYNVDNVAYLQLQGGETRSKAPLIGGVIVALLGVVLGVLSAFDTYITISLLLVALGALLMLYYYAGGGGGVALGTTTGEERLEVDDTGSLESQFLDRAADTITISGSNGGSISSQEYRYHFVPDNIVSVERQQTDLTPKEWAAVVGVTAVPLAIAFIVGNDPGSQLPLIAAAFGVVSALLYAGFSRKDDGVVVELQSGTSRSFVMGPEDARSVLSEFGQR